MGGRGRCTGYANYFRDYKRLGPIAKLATIYSSEYAIDDLLSRLTWMLPSCTRLLPCATEGLRVCGPVVAIKAWGLFQRLRVHPQEEGA